MKTPVVFIIFKRFDTTQKVFEIIRQAQPSKLLVIADGPRANKPDELLQCADTRAIINQVDWECEVLTNYSDINLGCKKRVSTGLDWCFNIVEEAIILEDDCLPHLDFFRFCEELLDKYRSDERIMMIAGSNYMVNWNPNVYSYNFSFGNSIWGWASWKRAWKYYDPTMKLWLDSRIKDIVRQQTSDDIVFHYKTRSFNLAVSDQLDDWAFAWDFAKLIHSGLTIFPSVNLISNIAVSSTSRADEEHKTERELFSLISNLPTHSINFPLEHPCFVVADKTYDRVRILLACGIPRKKLILKFALSYIEQLISLLRSESIYRNLSKNRGLNKR